MPESARISLSSLLSRSSCTLPDVLSDLLSELLSDALPLSNLLSDSLPQLSLSHGPSSEVAPSAAGSLPVRTTRLAGALNVTSRLPPARPYSGGSMPSSLHSVNIF